MPATFGAVDVVFVCVAYSLLRYLIATSDPAAVGPRGEVKKVRVRANMAVSLVHRKLTDPIR